MKKKTIVALYVLMSVMTSACGKTNGSAEETLAEPDYILQEYETSTSDTGDTIINGFYRVENENPKVTLFIPYVENKKSGVFYLDDHSVNKKINSLYKQNELNNTPTGTALQRSSNCNTPFIEACTVPDFARKYYKTGETAPDWNLSDMASYAFVYSAENAGESKSTSKTMITEDVCAFSVAMYEEVYDEIPTMKVSVYGIPKSLFKDKFGKTFGSKEFLNYKDTLKKNNYKSCDLLCTKDINQTGVYYIDYTQLNKKGDYINYIIDYHFENIGEKVYLLTEKSGGYNITNNELFNQWKTEHAEQLINN